MKINKVQNNPMISSANRENERKADPKTTQATKSVNVEISSSAKELVNRINQIEDKGYSEKVEKIRKAVLEGTYRIDPGKIAQRILDTINDEKGSVE
ncbi:MAG TPA: flagellar biosynthesis anti-sigma factor FlgM [Gudongella oleilytica]|jgi:negative regulator of flagellin synthesis FlgM|nr:flagellar biosynthesis anti-sigma factor FlgM [Gudongella oleilytica]